MCSIRKWFLPIVLVCWSMPLMAQVPDSPTIPEVDSLCQVAQNLSDQQQFDAALEMIVAAAKVAVNQGGEGSAAQAVCRLNEGRIHSAKGDYPEAERCFQEAKAIAEKVFGKNHRDYAQCLVELGLLYSDLGRLQEAEAVFLEAMPIWEATLGKANAEYAWNLNNLGMLYYDLGQYAKAEGLYQESRSIREATLGKVHPVYAGSLINLGILYWKTGQLDKAESFYLEAKSIFEEQLHDTNHPFYRNCLSNLSIVYVSQGHYEQAQPLYIQSLALVEKSKGKENPEYARGLNNLAVLYMYDGKLEKAEPCYIEAIRIRKKTLGEDHMLVASSLNNLAALYEELGQYAQVESLYLETLEIRKKALGADHPDYAQTLINLALFYEHTGNLDKSEAIYLQALPIFENSYGKDHPSYASSLKNFANLYLARKQFDRAEAYYLEARSIREATVGKMHPEYATDLVNLAILYLEQKREAEAGKALQEARTIQDSTVGVTHPEYARTLFYLGEVAVRRGDLSKGEALHAQARQVREAAYGLQHPEVAYSLQRLAWVHERQGRQSDTELDLGTLLDQVQARLSKATSFLPEQELARYVRSFRQIGDQVADCVQERNARVEKAGSLPALLYNYILFYKGFLLSSAIRLKNLSDLTPASREIDLRLKSYRRRLAEQYALPLTDRKGVPELEEQARNAEKELIQTVAGFAEASQQLTWKDIRQVLQADQAAIEFLQYTRLTGTPDESVEYAALIIRSDRDQPEFVHLFSEASISRVLQTDTDRRSDYVNDLYAWADRGLVADEEPVPTLYQLIWSRLAATGLADIRTIYYAPTGVLHRLNLGAIAVNDEQVLSDVYQLIEVSSTRRLVEGSKDPVRQDNATGVVFGGLYFDPDTLAGQTPLSVSAEDLVASRGQVTADQAGSTRRTGSWSYLKWTEKEASAIKGILDGAGMDCRELDGYAGTEEVFKQICSAGSSPVVLHMATHGFFFPDPGGQQQDQQDLAFQDSENPMIRSGLILAGGNYTWRNGNPLQPGKEDGILTAYEISQMNLSNTELVVLSACETGLGDIEGNEGVYGLQRAFKIAGAKYLIMSLWQVPDRETMQFMTTFYRNWLEPEDGGKMTIPEAFRKTQLEMRDRFFNPYSWAGFVLVE